MKKLLFTIKAYQNRLLYFVFYWFITTLNVYFALFFCFSSLFDFINLLRMPANEKYLMSTELLIMNEA